MAKLVGPPSVKLKEASGRFLELGSFSAAAASSLASSDDGSFGPLSGPSKARLASQTTAPPWEEAWAEAFAEPWAEPWAEA
jgi:hypothetical protein